MYIQCTCTYVRIHVAYIYTKNTIFPPIFILCDGSDMDQCNNTATCYTTTLGAHTCKQLYVHMYVHVYIHIHLYLYTCLYTYIVVHTPMYTVAYIYTKNTIFPPISFCTMAVIWTKCYYRPPSTDARTANTALRYDRVTNKGLTVQQLKLDAVSCGVSPFPIRDNYYRGIRFRCTLGMYTGIIYYRVTII